MDGGFVADAKLAAPQGLLVKQGVATVDVHGEVADARYRLVRPTFS